LTRWETWRTAGTASELHARSAALVAATAGTSWPIAVVQSFTGSALVLGSAQPESAVDLAACAAAGVDVVRRRSGGGAVLVEPASVVWVDLVIGTTDPLWCADVGRSAWWLGEAWADALQRAGLGKPAVWKGPMERNAWSQLVCFAGLGPGEVVGSRRRKLVGISQRRTRYGALFQCACLLRWQPERLLDLLALDDADRQTAARELASAGAGIGAERAGTVLEGLLAHLP
jgi:lipoate-protein ligase A